ncbi:hypothetical protein [Paludisphaera mucosa]|uniref:Uncharacterized protein n=1 Tax=Paludisphaera mucosa TaxID=3030827 RepID=A0ABT6F6Y4_9BACT|nr:hypothetical protein [Paludisphaera mucosa]MDG3003284.1 hypothetical protein [Paludisphaera mucosa]
MADVNGEILEIRTDDDTDRLADVFLRGVAFGLFGREALKLRVQAHDWAGKGPAIEFDGPPEMIERFQDAFAAFAN